MAALLLAELGRREKSELAQAVSKADQDHAFFREIGAIVLMQRSGADREAAAVDPDHYGKFIVRGFRGRPHVEIEAVFIHRHCVEAESRHHYRNLHAAWREFVG